MIEWNYYSDSRVYVRIPKRLKKLRTGLIFKGRLERSDPKSEVMLTIDPDMNLNVAKAMKESLLGKMNITEWLGTTWEYHYRGESLTRPGGVEIKFTQMAPNNGKAHRWSIVFPIGSKWIYIDIANALGGVRLQEFDAIGDEIIRSVATLPLEKEKGEGKNDIHNIP